MDKVQTKSKKSTKEVKKINVNFLKNNKKQEMELEYTEHPGIMLVPHKWQDLSQQKNGCGQFTKSFTALKDTLTHIGFPENEYAIKRLHPTLKTATQTPKEAEFIKAIGDVLNSRDRKGKINYKYLIKKISDLIRYSQIREFTNVSDSAWSKCKQFTTCKEKKQEMEVINTNMVDVKDKIIIIKKNEIKEKIIEFWNSDEITRVSPSHTRVVKRKSKKNKEQVVESIRIRNYSINECFKLFLQKYPKLCSRSTFFKYKPKNIKTSKRYTDFCPICKTSKKILKMNPGQLGILQESYDDAVFHKELSVKRSEDIKNAINNITEGTCVLVMDFKENIQLGKEPVETSRNFFRAPQRLCLGVVGFFIKENKRYQVNFSIISKVLSHTSKIAIDILQDKILSHRIFTEFGIKDIKLWLDNGKHFKSKEFLHSMLTYQKFKIQLNFFCPYHGKSFCDQHFGVINRYYNSSTKGIYGKAICETKDFIQMYQDCATKSGNYVFYDNTFDLDSMKEIDTTKETGTYNCYMSEYTIPGVPDNNSKVEKIEIEYDAHKLNINHQDGVMNRFFQFDMVTEDSGKPVLLAKLHATHEKTHTLRFTVDTIEKNKITYRIGTQFIDPNPPSLVLKITNKLRSFHGKQI